MSTAEGKEESSAREYKPSYDPQSLLDYETDFISREDINSFAKALAAPTTEPVTALNDWGPIHQKVKRNRARRKPPRRSKDETREGFVYNILYYPLLFLVCGWIVFLFIIYNLTRFYIYAYEHIFTWRGRRETLRRQLQRSNTYEEWQESAQRLDEYLGNEDWKKSDPYSYYNHQTVARVTAQLADQQRKVDQEATHGRDGKGGFTALEELKVLLESCMKNNFVGIENPRLYSETYLGTKDLIQTFVDQVEKGLRTVLDSDQMSNKDKATFFRHLELNYGRTALCLSGGATFAYYHFGVVKALLDAGELPEIITGTSGGALVAALVATRTDEELKQLLVPALAYRIRACHEGLTTWALRWWKTGARFDSLDWALQCSWFCRGSLTFREAYERTGRILNVTCVPSDPHSPTILNNHITSPDCVIWSAVLASAAVPGILNPIVLMRKTRDGNLAPYSFGNKWKDGSLRTDIPLKALNIHFNVNFSIVSQVNPHINIFFFSPRGSPGRPVTHRKGRGWRGGFLGSTIETSVKLDLQKYLKILRHLELLPRVMGQDWSEIWLQRFSGTVTIWPKTVISDFWNILSDPSPQRLDRMLRVGQRSCWPKIPFISNRMKVERIILEGLRRAGPVEEGYRDPNPVLEQQSQEASLRARRRANDSISSIDDAHHRILAPSPRRPSTILEELSRQASVLWVDDGPTEGEDDGLSSTEEEMTKPVEGKQEDP
ncbi:patatin-like phospholipase domain-containing protein [Exophiala aquamarina CBS 119918]|uniref:Patatin-like phospholipase domain-containing protein n=1 Tax=Exophiala aquamarina CBS 119918 TaxID=1182545 RepID=A0A072PVY6_9EURO|nr:patatin-like phospholipase domain-containing protein [Exophiala aquamarina CBS 119918]KEF59725.1 patatin-like phospholipase domain-containing protein [Exophiala aquamarina CBS 119918]